MTKTKHNLILAFLLLTVMGFFLSSKTSHASILIQNLNTPTTTDVVDGGSNISAFSATTASWGGGDLYVKFYLNAYLLTSGSADGNTACFSLYTFSNLSSGWDVVDNADGISIDGGSTWATINHSTCIISDPSNHLGSWTNEGYVLLKYTSWGSFSSKALGISMYIPGSTGYGGYWLQNTTPSYTGSYASVQGNSYGCVMTSASDYNSCGGTPPPSLPNVIFDYPANGTTTAPFSQWIMSLTNVTSTSKYDISIHWQRINHDCGYNPLYDWANGTQFCQIYGDQIVGITGNATVTIAIPRPERNLNYTDDGNADDLWLANAYLKEQGVDGFVATSSIQFTLLRHGIANSSKALPGAEGTSTYIITGINASGTLTTGTSTNAWLESLPYGAFNQSSTCPSDTLGMCTVANLLFKADPVFVDSLQGNFNNFKTKFPFVIVFNLIDTAKINATTTNGNYDLYFTVPATGIKIPILTSSTLAEGIGSDNQALVFATEKNLAWILAGAGMLFLII